jgi:glycosyltransferase involved in cell wall biosynthesis
MKILLVHNYYSQRGGEDVYFDNLTRLLKSKGHKLILYTKSNAEIKGLGKKFSAILSIFASKNIVNNEISELIKKKQPDVAHFNNIFPLIGPAAYLACRQNNVPVIQTIHNYRLLPHKEASYGYDNYRSSIYRNIFRALIFGAISGRVFDLVDSFVFPTQFSRDIYLNNARFKINNPVIIPNFVDLPSRFAKVKKADYFVYAGRFSKEKGIIPLLDIFSKLPSLRLVAFGDGPQKKDALKYKKCDNIEIHDWTDRKTLFKYILKSQAVISPSLSYEVMPLGVIESLVLKTPVIVPEKGIFKEIVKHPDDAVFFKDGDFEDLRMKIMSFDKNKKVLTDYLKYFSPDNHYLKLIKLYRKFAKR